MAFDAFIKFPFPGESTDDKHKDWVEVKNYGFGASQPQSSTASSAGSLSSSRVDIQAFTFRHNLDQASPKLFEACCKGTHIPEVVMELCRAGGDKMKYMEYKLKDVLVTSVGRGGDSANEARDVPIEAVTLAFGSIEMTYTKIGMDGKAAGNQSAGWDLKGNKAIA